MGFGDAGDRVGFEVRRPERAAGPAPVFGDHPQPALALTAGDAGADAAAPPAVDRFLCRRRCYADGLGLWLVAVVVVMLGSA
jgi:hypothetical protein